MSIRVRPIAGGELRGPRPKIQGLKVSTRMPGSDSAVLAVDAPSRTTHWHRLVVLPVAGSVAGIAVVLVALNILPPWLELALNSIPQIAGSGIVVSIPDIPGPVQLLVAVGVNLWPMSKTVNRVLAYRGWHLDLAPPCPVCGGPMIQRRGAGEGEAFWNCTRYPVCSGIEEPGR